MWASPHEPWQRLQELNDESDNWDVKMNKLKIRWCWKVTWWYMLKPLKSREYWKLCLPGTTSETKTKTRFKEESRPTGQHSPSTTTSSRVILERHWRDKYTTYAYFQQWHTVWKHGHSPTRQRTSWQLHKQGTERSTRDVKHHILGHQTSG